MKMLPLLFLLTLTTTLSAQWNPGEVYREFIWVTPEGGEAFLRVGGRYGYQQTPGKFPDSLQRGDQLLLPAVTDLGDAVRAELVLEKVMSHEDSRDLRVEVNGHAPLTFPEPATIPEPQTEYMYHTDVRVEVPLGQLSAVQRNELRFTLDTTQRWGWPQNLLYAITLRVYYAASTTPASQTFAAPVRQAQGPPATAPPSVVSGADYLGEVVYLIAQTAFATQHVDYIMVGEDTDWSGRGVTNRKHWQTHRGKPLKTIGRSADTGDHFTVRWDTRWVPDQSNFGLQCRALGPDGKYRVSEVLTNQNFAARPYRVALYAPEPAPRNWVTRSGEFSQVINVPDAVDDVLELQLNWVSWSPCYSNGLFLNGHLLWDRTDDCYVYATHSPVFTGHDTETLLRGENKIHTALTPLFRGKMVHGMEVQWPGVQLKVRRRIAGYRLRE